MLPPGDRASQDGEHVQAGWLKRLIPAKRKPRKQDDTQSLGIRDFFKDTDRLSVTQSWQYRGLGLAAPALVALYIYMSFHKSNPVPFWYSLPNDLSTALRDVVGFVATAAISIWASLVVVYFLNKANLIRIEMIRHLAHEDILSHAFETIGRYDHKHSENKHVSIVFEEVLRAKNGYMAARCVHTVTMRLKPNRPSLILKFQKLSRSPNSGEKAKSIVDLMELVSPDDVYAIDTTDIDANFPGRQDLFAGVTEVIINSTPQELKPVGDDSALTWSFKIDEAFSEIDLEYTYEYTHEIPGFTLIEMFEPTRGLVCRLDYRKLLDEMSCYYFETIDPTRSRHDAGRDKDGVITYAYKDWILPRSSVVFCWYKKSQPVNGMVEQQKV
jgi:hypothetical protein